MGAFKLGKMTLGSLFKKPETVLYPIEKKQQPAGLKGHIVIDVDTCILCGMCDRSCATNCITVDKGASTWSIDRLQCVQCGYCITVCPKKSLTMSPDYAPATTVHEPEVVEIPEVEKPRSKTPTAATDKPDSVEEAAQVASVSAEAKPKAPVADATVLNLVNLMDDEKAAKVMAALNG